MQVRDRLGFSAPGAPMQSLRPAPACSQAGQAGLGDEGGQRDCLTIAADLLLLRLHPLTALAPLRRACEAYGRALLCLLFVQRGHFHYRYDKDRCWTLAAGQSGVLLLNNPVHASQCRAEVEGSGLCLLLGEQTLCRYMGQEQCQRLLGCRAQAPLLQLSIRRETQCHLQALSSQLLQEHRCALDIHIHALNLLSRPLKALTSVPTGTRPALPGADARRLEQVRQVMLDELDRPLSISMLCARVGLSATKLKEGFHRCFQTTPHRMLLELRMQRAHALLQDGCQVAQVAYQVGYRHPSNFSAAFSEYFGFAPKRVFAARKPG